MAIQLKDRILTLCTTTGTNDAIVGATKEGYQGWEGITVGNTVYYCITDSADWEVGYGQYLSRAGTPTIQRNVLSSSNNNEKLELTGNASIFCTYPSEKAVFLNADDNMYYPSTNINASKFIGDGSALTNLPNDNVWKDNGSTIQYDGDGSSSTQVVAENNGKQAKMTQKSSGLTYFTGEAATYFGTEADEVVKIITNNEAQLALSSIGINAFQPFTAPSFIGDGSQLTGLPPSGIPEAPIDNLTYARNNATWVNISDTSGIPDAPVTGLQYGRQDGEWTPTVDAYTKAESNATTDAQDAYIEENNINIADNTVAIQENTDAIDSLTGAIIYKGDINVTDTDAPVDSNNGDMYINNYNVAEPDTEYPVTGWGTVATISYNDRIIKTDTDWDVLPASSSTSDTYTKAEIDAQQEAQDVNISSNTTAVGTLSGQVSQNSEDIAELQDSIFFSSAYSADYPSTPNRDPEDGNMYLQNLALFTYSYADATQIFASKTDESGNVRQFTAVKPGDSIVLNQVESPNYGRYELVSVEDVSDSYVVMNVIPKMGQGTVITGVKVAFQAFPQPGSTSIWTEEDGVAVYDGDIEVNGVTVGTGNTDNKTNTALGQDALSNTTSTGNYNSAVGDKALSSVTTGGNNTAIGWSAGSTLVDGSNNIIIGRGAEPSSPDVSNEVTIGNDSVTVTRLKGEVQTTQDMTVNGVTVGNGGGSIDTNTSVGLNALRSNTTGTLNTAIGRNSLRDSVDGSNNTAVGYYSLVNSEGGNNTALGKLAGSTLTTGNNNTLIGNEAEPSSPDVSNEVTIGNDDVTKTRLKGAVEVDSTLYSTNNLSLASSVGGSLALRQGSEALLRFDPEGLGSFTSDMTVNGVTVGTGSGTLNTVVGDGALSTNTAGGDNTAVGNGALRANEGSRNTALGYNALTKATDANNTTAVGWAALGALTTGVDNIAIGKSSASTLTSGNNNIVIGTSAQPSAPGVDNEVTIGNNNVTKTILKGEVQFIGTSGATNTNTFNVSQLGAVTVGNATWSGGGTTGLGIQATSSDSSPYAFYIRNSDNDLITSVRCNGDTNIDGSATVTNGLTCSNVTMTGFPTTGTDPVYAPNMYIDDDGLIFKSGAVTTYMAKEEIMEQLAIKDKLIEKLSERLDSLELKFKALK